MAIKVRPSVRIDAAKLERQLIIENIDYRIKALVAKIDAQTTDHHKLQQANMYGYAIAELLHLKQELENV
jgi:hypothetical protein